MTRVSDEVLEALLPLCSAREVEKDIRDAAEKEYDRLTGEIGTLLVANDLLDKDGKCKIDLGRYGLSMFSLPRPTISRERLLELGVDGDIIAAATKTTHSTQIRISAKS